MLTYKNKKILDYLNNAGNRAAPGILNNNKEGEIVIINLSLIEKRGIESEDKLRWALYDINNTMAIDNAVKLKKTDEKYQIISGIHRVVACEILGYEGIPAIIIN